MPSSRINKFSRLTLGLGVVPEHDSLFHRITCCATGIFAHQIALLSEVESVHDLNTIHAMSLRRSQSLSGLKIERSHELVDVKGAKTAQDKEAGTAEQCASNSM